MSPQVEFLKSLIKHAQSGREQAITMLRIICSRAVDKAPVADLISIGQCLVRIGEEATRNEATRN